MYFFILEKENNSPNRRLNHQAVRKHPTAKAFKTVPLVPDVLGLYDNGQMDQLQDRLNRSFNDIINAKDNLLRLKSVNLNVSHILNTALKFIN